MFSGTDRLGRGSGRTLEQRHADGHLQRQGRPGLRAHAPATQRAELHQAGFLSTSRSPFLISSSKAPAAPAGVLAFTAKPPTLPATMTPRWSAACAASLSSNAGNDERSNTTMKVTTRYAAACLSAFYALAPAVSSHAAQTTTLQDLAGQLASPASETTIYVAREFLTMNPKQPRVQAVAVKDGRFVAVGTPRRGRVRRRVGCEGGLDLRRQGGCGRLRRAACAPGARGADDEHQGHLDRGLGRHGRVLAGRPRPESLRGAPDRGALRASGQVQALHHLGLSPLPAWRPDVARPAEQTGAGFPRDRLASLLPRVLLQRCGAETGRH
jgi:hypothetical protein